MNGLSNTSLPKWLQIILIKLQESYFFYIGDESGQTVLSTVCRLRNVFSSRNLCATELISIRWQQWCGGSHRKWKLEITSFSCLRNLATTGPVPAFPALPFVIAKKSHYRDGFRGCPPCSRVDGFGFWPFRQFWRHSKVFELQTEK